MAKSAIPTHEVRTTIAKIEDQVSDDPPGRAATTTKLATTAPRKKRSAARNGCRTTVRGKGRDTWRKSQPPSATSPRRVAGAPAPPSGPNV